MNVVHWGRARTFFKSYPKAKLPLEAWRAAVLAAKWVNPADIKKTFNTADFYKDRVIFDIKGNDFRLIAIVRFEFEKVYIRHVLTHKEYDSGQWKLAGPKKR